MVLIGKRVFCFQWLLFPLIFYGIFLRFSLRFLPLFGGVFCVYICLSSVKAKQDSVIYTDFKYSALMDVNKILYKYQCLNPKYFFLYISKLDCRSSTNDCICKVKEKKERQWFFLKIFKGFFIGNFGINFDGR